MSWSWQGLGKRALEFPKSGTQVSVSPLGRARIRYNDILNRLEQSLNGAAYVAIGGGSGVPGGVDTSIQYNDGGAFGGNANFTYDGTSATFENNLLLGDNIIFDNLSDHSILTDKSDDDTVGRALTISSGDGGDSPTTNAAPGGTVNILGGAGGDSTSGDSGGLGGRVSITGGVGGGGESSGDAGGVSIDGGVGGGGSAAKGDVDIGQNSARNIQIGSSSGNMTGQIINNMVNNLANAFTLRDPTTAYKYLHINTLTGSEIMEFGTPGQSVDMDFRGTGAITIGDTGATVGFLGAGAIARPNVTGSRGGNAALTSFLAAMDSLGLITDSTGV